MSSTQEKPLDLTPLSDKYDLAGEYSSHGSNPQYRGRRKEDGRDVLITIMRAAADVAEGKAIAQFAADANLLATLSHPNMPRVIEGRWIGDDAFALVTERIHGSTVAELLKGERLTNPRVADILRDVDGVLEWARGERLSHRNVTPDGITIERGTGKVYVSLSPTDAPKTNRPDARDDARIIGALALAMLTAKPMADDHDGTLINMRPDLPQRVVDATEKVAACTINDEQPNISAYLASLAMADAIKEGEVEVARVEAEFRAQMKAERECWEAEQEALRQANEAQARKFAEERAEYERRMAKEREQLATARAEIDRRRTEVQEARAELDNARAAYKKRKAELEARAKQVDKHMSDLEKQKRQLEKRTKDLERKTAELEQKNHELEALSALAASANVPTAEMRVEPEPTSVEGLLNRIKHVGEIARPTQAIPAVEEFEEEEVEELEEPDQDPVEVMADAVEAEDEVHAWTPIETAEPWSVPLDTDEPVRTIAYEAAAVPEPVKKSDRRGWVVPASVVGLLLLVAGGAYGVKQLAGSKAGTGPLVASAPTSASARTTSVTPIVDSAAGVVGVTNDSLAFAAIRDSIIAADAARAARRQRAAIREAEEAAAERRREAYTITDAQGNVWSTVSPDSLEKIRRADSARIAREAAAPPVIPVPKIDTLKVKPKPDTGKVRPDTTRIILR